MTSIRKLANVASLLLATMLLGACNSPTSSSDASATHSSQDPTYTGHALLGPLVNAKVEVYSLASLDGTPIFTTETNDSENLDEAGQFSIPASALNDDGLYVVKVIGGQDVDADDDGVRDNKPTENKGAIHALLTADQIRRGDYHISILTEVLYRRLAYLLSAGYSKDDIRAELNYRASVALKTDINGDGVINDDDAVAWQPRLNQAALRRGFAPYQHLQELVHGGATIGAEAFLPTGRDVARIDLGGLPSYFSKMAIGNGIAGVIGVTPPSTYFLSVIDVSNPFQSRKAGTLNVDPTNNIVAQGKFFYISTDTALEIIDASNPDSPVESASLTLPSPGRISVDGNFAYLATGGASCSLVVVDISQPTAPKLMGSVACSGSPGLIAYHNGALYTVLDKNKIQIFDVSNPESPAPAGIVDIEANGTILFNGTTAYVMDAASQLNIIDVSDIHQPLIMEKMDLAHGQLAGMDSDTLFVHAGATIQAYDVSAPADPVLSAQFSGSAGYHSGTQFFKDRLYYDLAANLLSIYDLHTLYSAPQINALAHTDIPDTTAFDIAVDDNSAYLSSSGDSNPSGSLNGLAVVDITDSLAPKFVSRVETPGDIVEATATGNKLYVNGQFDVAQLDTTTPSHPVVTGYADHTFGPQLALRGNFLYSAAWDKISVFDTTQAHKLTAVGALYHQKLNFSDISLNDAGKIACTVDGEGTLQLIDVSGTNPVLIKTLDADFTPNSCRFHGDFVFVTTSNDLEVIDASTPREAKVVERATVKTSSPMIFNGNIAYVSDGDNLAIGGSTKIYVYDVSDPTNLVLENVVPGYLGKHAVLQNDKIYTRGQNWYYFTILDVSNALNPSLVGAITGLGDSIYPFAVSGTVAYLLTYDIKSQQKTLQVVDVSNPALPAVISSLSIPDPPGTNGIGIPTIPTALIAKNNTVYIAGWDMGFQIIDVSDPLNPQIAGAHYYPIDHLDDIAANGPYAYISDDVLGLHVLDFTDPANPIYYDVSGSQELPNALTVDGNMLYAVNKKTFQAIDISDPAQARVVGSVAIDLTSAYYSAIRVINHIAYVTGSDKLITIDVADPAHPAIVAPSINLAHYGTIPLQNIPILNNKLYIARGASGVEVVDISNPTHPHTAGIIPIPAVATAVKGDYLYSTGQNSLDVIKPMNHSLP